MWLTIAVIFLAVMMMIGPIMMIQPSPRQRALSKLRINALKKNLHVTMVSNPIGDDPSFLAEYSYPKINDDKQQKKVTSWRLTYKNYEHELHFYKHWDGLTKGLLSVDYENKITQVLTKLPMTIVAIEMKKIGPAITWKEVPAGENHSVEVTLELIDEALKSLHDYALR